MTRTKGGIRQGGAFELKQATWALRQALQSPEAEADSLVKKALEAELKNIFAWFSRLPWRKGQSPLRWLPEFEEYLFEQWTRGDYDDFWRKLGICSKAFMDDFADVPMVHMSSWFDPYPRTATNNYIDLKKRGKGTARSHPWPLDARGSLSQLLGGRGFRPRGYPGRRPRPKLP